MIGFPWTDPVPGCDHHVAEARALMASLARENELRLTPLPRESEPPPTPRDPPDAPPAPAAVPAAAPGRLELELELERHRYQRVQMELELVGAVKTLLEEVRTFSTSFLEQVKQAVAPEQLDESVVDGPPTPTEEQA